MKLTDKESRLLEVIKELQNERGHSDFLSGDGISKSGAGVVSSLEKKGLIYDSYADMTWEVGEKPFKMWCLTDHAIIYVGKPEYWEPLDLYGLKLVLLHYYSEQDNNGRSVYNILNNTSVTFESLKHELGQLIKLNK